MATPRGGDRTGLTLLPAQPADDEIERFTETLKAMRAVATARHDAPREGDGPDAGDDPGPPA